MRLFRSVLRYRLKKPLRFLLFFLRQVLCGIIPPMDSPVCWGFPVVSRPRPPPEVSLCSCPDHIESAKLLDGELRVGLTDCRIPVRVAGDPRRSNLPARRFPPPLRSSYFRLSSVIQALCFMTFWQKGALVGIFNSGPQCCRE